MSNETKSSHAPYVKKADKCKDLYSSGIMLVLVGLIGDVYIVLNALSLAPIQFEGISAILFYIIMGLLFNVFLISGIRSFRSASRIQKEVSTEETLTEDIISYITTNYPKEFFDTKFDTKFADAEDIDENTLYFERVEFIRTEIINKFGNQDEAFLEHMIEQLYQNIFES